ncbi:MAG: phosphopyruvate hydratase [Candidatus Parvarchaeota archaeon]
MKINNISAIQLYDSRGNPTIETEVELDNGVKGYGLVPSGASVGQYEAIELRDGDPSRFRGLSVFKAINNVENIIGPFLKGRDAADQQMIDESLIALDGTENKSRLGANAILSVSIAVANAVAKSNDQQLFEYLGKSSGNLLPLPEIQIVGGGAHADWAIDIQDFMLVVLNAKSYEEVMEVTFDIHRAAGEILRSKGKNFGVADEGGFWPNFRHNEEGLELMVDAMERAGYVPGRDVAISLDVAASNLFSPKDGLYKFRLENRSFTSIQFAELLAQWCKEYPIISIEDPMADTDWDGWKYFSDLTQKKLQIVGDDLFVTNIRRIKEGIERNVANSVLIKMNQVGTITETIRAIEFVKNAGWLPIISGRSGETEDATIVHLAVATNAGQIKTGSFARSERMVKWNEVLRIKRYLKDNYNFLGSNIFRQSFDWGYNR